MARDFFEGYYGIADPEDGLSDKEREKLEKFENKIKEKFCDKFGGIEAVSKEKHLRTFYNRIPNMVVKAREIANEKGDSYRGFKVGCVVLGYNFSFEGTDRSPYLTFTASNSKPCKTGPKVCAEQIAVNSAAHTSFENEKTSIIGLVVAGNAQEDSKSGLTSPTLHPCHDCRMLVSSRLEKNKDRLEDIILLTVGLDNDTFEIQTWDELLKEHGDLVDIQ